MNRNSNNRRVTRKNTNSFNIYYGSIRVHGQQLSRAQTKGMPRLVFKPKKGKYYTILMYDLHSPKPAFLHFAAFDVQTTDSMTPFVSYVPPSPPSTDTHYHVYMFNIYEQPGILTNVPPPDNRSGFNPETFARIHKLRKLAQRGFYVNPRADA